jgi:hypothetical protein
MTPLSQEELAPLYTGSLEEFVPTRNDLAKRLSSEGRDAEAAWVRKLKKPNLAAWAGNQLAHKHQDELARLIDVWDRLAAAPHAAAVAELAGERKKIIGRLLELAQKELGAIGKGSASTLEKVAQMLNSGVIGEEREALLEGRLERELEPAGFAAWTGSGLPDPEVARAEREIERAHSEVRAAQEEADRTARRAEEAEASIGRAVEAADSARSRAEKAKEALEGATERLKEAEERLRG